MKFLIFCWLFAPLLPCCVSHIKHIFISAINTLQTSQQKRSKWLSKQKVFLYKACSSLLNTVVVLNLQKGMDSFPWRNFSLHSELREFNCLQTEIIALDRLHKLHSPSSAATSKQHHTVESGLDDQGYALHWLPSQSLQMHLADLASHSSVFLLQQTPTETFWNNSCITTATQ